MSALESEPTNLFEVFAAAAARSPDAIALEVDGVGTTYRMLDGMASAVADRLTEAGCSPGDRVLLVAERSRSTYASYLGILRAGAAVVPVGSDEARSRYEGVAGESGARFVICTDEHRLEPLSGVRCLTWPAHGPAVEAPSRQPVAPVPSSAADSEAYVLFTSGSTGVPKGVRITHGNVLSWIPTLARQFELRSGSRVSSGIELTFDPSVITLFGAWHVGATAVIPGRSEALRPASFIRDHGVTHWTAVPSSIDVAHALGDLEEDSMPSLVQTICGAESMSGLQLRRWLRAAPTSGVLHVYGPTEVTVFCATHRSALGDASESEILPIGRMLPGLEHVLLDAQLRPSGSGQLAVRGPQRFPGYVDPGMNQGRFVTWEPGMPAAETVPSATPGPRDWFLTGDLMQDADGLLTFRGRADQQVKLRGFRVELGEVEAKVATVDGVDAAAAVVVGDGAAARLVVFAATQRPLSTRDVMDALTTRLPHYMLPSEVIPVAALPLTRNGKVDRAALAMLARRETTGSAS